MTTRSGGKWREAVTWRIRGNGLVGGIQTAKPHDGTRTISEGELVNDARLALLERGKRMTTKSKRWIVVAIILFALLNILACDIETDMDRGWMTATVQTAERNGGW